MAIMDRFVCDAVLSLIGLSRRVVYGLCHINL